MQKVATPAKKTCDEVAAFLNLPVEQTVKTIAVIAQGRMYLLLLRGDHHLNETKIRKIPFLADFRLAREEEIRTEIGCIPGYIGPVGLQLPVVADRMVAAMSNFVCGANEEGYHLINVNFGRDVKEPDHILDIRNRSSRRSVTRWSWAAGYLPRHRGGAYFQAAYQIFRSNECQLPG